MTSKYSELLNCQRRGICSPTQWARAEALERELFPRDEAADRLADEARKRIMPPFIVV